MSDTPRTDEAKIQYYEAEHRGCVPIDFAEKLERENDQLAKQCVVFVEEIGLLRLELEEANKDKARMEWLAQRYYAEFRFRGSRYDLTRCAIDAIMEAANNE
jgi:regulator of sirC expression with transglutaminase-like and TPR domain